MDTVAVGPKYNSGSVPLDSASNQQGNITNCLASVEGTEQSLHQTASRFVNAIQTVATKVLGTEAAPEISQTEESGLKSLQGTVVVPMDLPAGRGDRGASNSTATEIYYKETLGAGAETFDASVTTHTALAGDKQYRQEQTRKVSSTIIEQVELERPPEDKITYIDVPTMEEEVIYVTKKEKREVVKKVKKPVHVPREVIVEVPPKPIIKSVEKIRYVDQIVEKVITKPVDKPVPNYIDQIEYRDVIVEKPVPQVVYDDVESIHWEDRAVETIEYVDEEVPVIISQQIKPIFVETPNNYLDVNVVDYEPEVIPIDIHVAKPIQSILRSGDAVENTHKIVTINSAQYNSILRRLNAHLGAEFQNQLPFISEGNVVNFVPDSETQYIIAPSGIEIEGYQLKKPITTTLDRTSLTREVVSNDREANLQSGFRSTGLQSAVHSQTVSTTADAANRLGSRIAGEAFEGYRTVQNTVGAPSDTSGPTSVHNPQVQRSARVCCNVKAADLSSQGGATSVTSSRQIALSTNQGQLVMNVNTNQLNAQVEGVRDYAAKLAQQRISQDQNTSQQSTRMTHNTSRLQGTATYPAGTRQAGGSRPSVSASSIRVDTVQSYRSQLEQARRSRVCC